MGLAALVTDGLRNDKLNCLFGAQHHVIPLNLVKEIIYNFRYHRSRSNLFVFDVQNGFLWPRLCQRWRCLKNDYLLCENIYLYISLWNKYYYSKLSQIKCTADITIKESINTLYIPTLEFLIWIERSSMLELIRFGFPEELTNEQPMPIKVTLYLLRHLKSKDLKLTSGNFLKRFKEKTRGRIGKVCEWLERCPIGLSGEGEVSMEQILTTKRRWQT